MVQLVSLLVYLTAIASGILGLYVLRKQKQKWSLALGLSSPLIILGSVSLLGSYGLVSATFLWTLIGSAMFVFLWFVYESTGRERRSIAIFPIFIGWFALLLVELYVFFFPPAILFVYTSVALATTHSYDLSKTEVRASIAKLKKYSRVLALPFAFIDSEVRTRIEGAATSRALFVGYLLFELVLLLVVPAVVMVAFGNATAFYALNFITTGVILFARWETGSL